MDPTAHSHRRALWLIIGLLLGAVVGLVGYELNWVRERREARADLNWWGERVLSQMWDNRQVFQVLPARGANYLDLLTIGAVDEHYERFFVPCPSDDAKLIATFKDRAFSVEAIEELAQVRRAHRLFPEAPIFFVYFVDADSKLIPFPAYSCPSGRTTIP